MFELIDIKDHIPMTEYIYNGYGHKLVIRYMKMTPKEFGNIRINLRKIENLAPCNFEITADYDYKLRLSTPYPISYSIQYVDDLIEYLELIKKITPEIEKIRKEIEEKHGTQ